jgi:hypothetical protein
VFAFLVFAAGATIFAFFAGLALELLLVLVAIVSSSMLCHVKPKQNRARTLPEEGRISKRELSHRRFTSICVICIRILKNIGSISDPTVKLSDTAILNKVQSLSSSQG